VLRAIDTDTTRFPTFVHADRAITHGLAQTSGWFAQNGAVASCDRVHRIDHHALIDLVAKRIPWQSARQPFNPQSAEKSGTVKSSIVYGELQARYGETNV
jgi:hypothetical protein